MSASETAAAETAAPEAAAADAAERENDGRDPAAKTYTAVVYFHGMGSQRRYEELSRLVDALDDYAHRHADRVGKLRKIEARLEPPRGALRRDVGYIRVVHSAPRADGEWARRVVRFYEVYWAPIAAEGSSTWEVVKWLLRQVPDPIRALRTPWRLRARLRRAALHAWWSRRAGRKGFDYDRADLARLLRLYDDYDGPDAWRDHPRGGFGGFLEFVRARGEPAHTARTIALARLWRRRYVAGEVLNLFTLLTVVAALAIGVAAVAAAVVLLLRWLGGLGLAERLAGLGGRAFEPTPGTVSAIVVAIFGVAGVLRFLRDYLGDVQLWTTYEETDAKCRKRREILELGQQVLDHVLRDEACDRVAVVGHSLGTTVAFDTLLELARHNRARRPDRAMDEPLPLRKIEHFVTLASPIDKVHYFFESYQTRYHRYNRVVEEIRGDIGTVPFAVNGRPHIHWINYWDRADVIGGSLETPTNRERPGLRVDNVEVVSLTFPDPAASHSAYFRHEPLVRDLFAVIFRRAYSFVTPPTKPDGSPDFGAQQLGPGRGQARVPAIQALMLALPWLVILAVLAHLDGWPDWLRVATLCLAAVSLGVLVVGWILGRMHGQVEPVRAA